MTEPRLEERLASEFIKVWLDGRGDVELLGNGDTPDIAINYHNGRKVYCEVKRDSDQAIERLRNRLENYGEILLGEGLGAWSIQVTELIDVREFGKSIPGLIRDMNDIGISDWDTRDRSLKFMSQDLLIRYKVSSIHRINGVDESYARFWLAPQSGVVIEESNIAISWLNDIQFEDDFVGSIRRLDVNNLKEAHLFIWADSKTPDEISTMLSFHSNRLPTVDLKLLPCLTHLWVASTVSFLPNYSFCWLYSKEAGWELIQVKLPVDQFWANFSN